MTAVTAPTLDDVCEFIVDCLHKTAPTQDTGFPLIRTPNIGKGSLILDDVYRVSDETYDIWTQRAVPEAGDLILAREAPAGNVAVIKNGQRVCLGQRTVHLRPNPEKVDSDFLCYFLLVPSQQGMLLAGETGATAKHVNMKDIRKLKLEGLPSLRAQRRAGAILSAFDDLIENNRRRMTLLEEAARQLYSEWFVRLRFPGHEHPPPLTARRRGGSERRWATSALTCARPHLQTSWSPTCLTSVLGTCPAARSRCRNGGEPRK
jgi:type I restriction enzyme, S subunit